MTDHAHASERDLRIDTLRGFALLIIFSDHIRGNAVRSYMPIAMGFSDMAEVLIFLSGYACGGSYARKLRDQGFISCSLRAWNRAAQIFAAKMIASMLALVLFFMAEKWVTPRFQGIPWSMGLVKRFPGETFLQFEMFRLDLYQYCVLSLYLLLLLPLPILLIGLHRSPWLVLAISAAIYIAAQVAPDKVSLPSPWRQAVYFNPFSWQILFVIAALLSTLKPELRSQIRPSQAVGCAAIAILTVAAVAHHMLAPASIPWRGKQNLEILRLFHFAAVILALQWITPASLVLSRIVFLRPVIVCGRNPLACYCAAGLIGVIGEVGFIACSRDWPMQVAINVSGIAACIGFSALWESIWRSKNSLKTSLRSTEPSPIPL